MKALLLALCLTVFGVAVAIADDYAPGRVTDFAAATYYASIRLTWSDSGVGDDCGSGTASTWEIRISTSPINSEAAWCAASQHAAGDMSDDGCALYTAGCPAQTRYFAIVYYDEAGNRGPIAAISGSTRCTPPYHIAECP